MKQYKPIEVTLKLNGGIYFKTTGKLFAFGGINLNILLKLN